MLCYNILYACCFFLAPTDSRPLQIYSSTNVLLFVFSSIYEICSCRLFRFVTRDEKKKRIQIILLSNSIQTNYIDGENLIISSIKKNYNIFFFSSYYEVVILADQEYICNTFSSNESYFIIWKVLLFLP